jgi:antitoxin component HigA of HigAB toxin-antitoxin module
MVFWWMKKFGLRFWGCNIYIYILSVMKIHFIKDEEGYQQALERLEMIFDAKKSEEGMELETLGILIEQYEDEHFPIDL